MWQDSSLPASAEILHDICSSSEGLDLVGFLTAGPIYRGFANSLGQRNWHSNASFLFDWSCYRSTDKAIKSRYAGLTWQREKFAAKMATVHTQLRAFDHPSVQIEPGLYRVFLAPMALTEIMEMLSWGGFGLKEHKTRQSALNKLAQGEKVLDRRIQLCENHAQGVGA